MTVLSFAKLVACAFIISLGIWQLIVGGSHFLLFLVYDKGPELFFLLLLLLSPLQDHLTNFTHAFSCTTTSPGNIALAFYSVMWAYDGWSVLIIHHEPYMHNSPSTYSPHAVLAHIITTKNDNKIDWGGMAER